MTSTFSEEVEIGMAPTTRVSTSMIFSCRSLVLTLAVRLCSQSETQSKRHESGRDGACSSTSLDGVICQETLAMRIVQNTILPSPQPLLSCMLYKRADKTVSLVPAFWTQSPQQSLEWNKRRLWQRRLCDTVNRRNITVHRMNSQVHLTWQPCANGKTRRTGNRIILSNEVRNSIPVEILIRVTAGLGVCMGKKLHLVSAIALPGSTKFK